MLDITTKTQLVDALLACKSISDEGMRQAVLVELPTEIKNNISYHANMRVHVFNIVNTCLAYYKGMEELLKILHLFEGDSLPLQEVERIWAYTVMPGILTDQQLDALFPLAGKANIPEETLDELYQFCLPDGFPSLPSPHTLWTILKHLQNIPRQPDGSIAILLFVEHLSHRTTDLTAATNLQTWVEQTAPTLDLTAAEITMLCQQVQMHYARAAVPPPPHNAMLVEISPDATNRNSDKAGFFRVSALLWREDGSSVSLYQGDTSFKLPEIPPLIDRIISEEAALQVHDLADLALEFFLPLPLISYDVDQWLKKDLFQNPVKLGEDHPVVVRSLERATNPRLQLGWRHRWEQFQGAPGHEPTFQLCPKKKYGANELLNALKYAEHVTCVGVTFLLSDRPEEQQILSQVLGAGIPVALWPRTGHNVAPDAEEIPKKIATIVSAEHLKELPRLVKEERLNAINETHLGNYLTLLWDDPDKLPPRAHLKSSQ